MANLHILVGLLVISSGTLRAATIDLQKSTTDFSFNDAEGQMHHEHLIVDVDYDKQVIEVDGDEDHAPATFVFENQKGLLGVFDPSAGASGECYLIPNLESDNEEQDADSVSEKYNEEKEEEKVILLKRTSNTSISDHSMLSPELQSVCADKPLYWAHQVQGSPNDTVTGEVTSSTELGHPRQKRGILGCAYGAYKCYRAVKRKCLCRRRCCITYKVLICAWHIITKCVIGK